jgi:large subunit ribosomal protein L33
MGPQAPAETKTMAKKNLKRIQVILECTESRESDVPGVSRYVTVKNRQNTTERLELMKYNKFLRKHTLHKEIK